MPEPTRPPTDSSAFGVRGQPSGSLGGVDHIQDHIDLGAYVAWLKTVDQGLQTSINNVAGDVSTNTADISSLGSSVFSLATAISTAETWNTWTGAILTASAGSVSLGTGGSTVGLYKHQGFDVEADFVVTLGTGFSLGTNAAFQRISLPVPADSFYSTNEGILGYGHLHDKSGGGFGFPAGPGPLQLWPFQLIGVSASVAGIWFSPSSASATNIATIGALPYTPAAGDKYIGKIKYKSASHA